MTILRLKSKNLNKLNESLQRISLFEDDVKTSNIQKDNDDDTFFTDITTDNEQNVADNMNDDDQINVVEPEDSEEVQKQKLTAEFSNLVSDLLSKTQALKKTLQDYNDVDEKETELSNSWVLNKDKNDLYLESKDAHIFRQNVNICLSHDQQVETFRNEGELSKWLETNNYPALPQNILSSLVESTIDQISKLLTEAAPKAATEDELARLAKLLRSHKKADQNEGLYYYNMIKSKITPKQKHDLYQAFPIVGERLKKYIKDTPQIQPIWKYTPKEQSQFISDINNNVPGATDKLKEILFKSLIQETFLNEHWKDIRNLLVNSRATGINNLETQSGKTPLMIAAEKGLTQTVKDLITAGAPVNEQDKEGNTALMYALKTPEKAKDIVASLLQQGHADIGIINNNGKDFKRLALQGIDFFHSNAQKNALRDLINRYADQKSNDWSTLWFGNKLINSVISDDVNQLKNILTSHRINPNTIHIDFETAKQYNVTPGDTLLNVAIELGHPEMVQTLLSFGANPFTKASQDADYRNAFDTAKRYANSSIEGEQILDLLQDVQTQQLNKLQTPTQPKEPSSKEQSRGNEIKTLAKSASSDDKQQALNIAVQSKDNEIVKALANTLTDSSSLTSSLQQLQEEAIEDFSNALNLVLDDEKESSNNKEDEEKVPLEDCCGGVGLTSAGLNTVAALTPAGTKKKKNAK